MNSVALDLPVLLISELTSLWWAYGSKSAIDKTGQLESSVVGEHGSKTVIPSAVIVVSVPAAALSVNVVVTVWMVLRIWDLGMSVTKP